MGGELLIPEPNTGVALNLRELTTEEEDRWQYEVFRGDKASITFWEAWRWWRGIHTTLIIPSNPNERFKFPAEFLDEYQKRLDEGHKKRGGILYHLMMCCIGKSNYPPAPPVPPYPKATTARARYLDPPPPPEPKPLPPPVPPAPVKVEQTVIIPPEVSRWVQEVFPLYIMEKYGHLDQPWLEWERDPKRFPLHPALLKDAQAGFTKIRNLLNG